jgi:hypothetical protein
VLSCVEAVPFKCVEIAALVEEAMDLVILDVRAFEIDFSERSKFFF